MTPAPDICCCQEFAADANGSSPKIEPALLHPRLL
jgi:hypothetical protein